MAKEQNPQPQRPTPPPQRPTPPPQGTPLEKGHNSMPTYHNPPPPPPKKND